MKPSDKTARREYYRVFTHTFPGQYGPDNPESSSVVGDSGRIAGKFRGTGAHRKARELADKLNS